MRLSGPLRVCECKMMFLTAASEKVSLLTRDESSVKCRLTAKIDFICQQSTFLTSVDSGLTFDLELTLLTSVDLGLTF